MGARSIFAASLLILLLASTTGKAPPQLRLGELSVLTAVEKDGRIFVGGYLDRKHFWQPVLGVVADNEGALLLLPGRGAILNIKPTRQGVAGFGFIVDEEGAPRAAAVLLGVDGSHTAYLVSADASFYGVDGLVLEDGEIILLGYVYASRYAGDSDILAVRLANNGSLQSFKCYGSVSYPDLPRRVLSSKDSVLVIGETWAYNVSQSDVLVLILDRGLNVRASYAVGGAGAETPEDAVLVDKDLVVVGTTTADGYGGFVMRVSEVGGLMWLRAFKGLGTTLVTSVDYTSEGVMRVLGLAEVEEGVKAPILVTLREKSGWAFEFSGVKIFDAGNLTLTPVSVRNGAVFLWGGDVLFKVGEGSGRAWAETPPGLLQLSVLNHSLLESIIERTLHGWRSIPGIVGERPCDLSLSVKQLEPTVVTLKWREFRLSVASGEYKSRAGLETLVLRWLERNIPLIILSPVLVMLALLALPVLRRGWPLRYMFIGVARWDDFSEPLWMKKMLK